MSHDYGAIGNFIILNSESIQALFCFMVWFGFTALSIRIIWYLDQKRVLSGGRESTLGAWYKGRMAHR